MNSVGLVLAATLLEGILGRTQLIAVFMVSGILASVASVSWYENTVSVGASGAIFGLYGLILSFSIFKIYPKDMRGLNWWLLGAYAGISLLLGFLGGIDNAAHFGGLISGFIVGVILILTDKETLIKNAS
jgi:rhomboid protease GluP